MPPVPYHPRALEPIVRDRLGAFPVVVLTGARQTGKSTLARELGRDERTYLTLDDLSVLDQARNAPDALLARAPRITLDEVQRAPDLLLAIKRAVDRERTPGRFLLTGSANLALMEGVSESLAGRAVYATLWPMTRSELGGRGGCGHWDAFVDLAPSDWATAIGEAPPGVDWHDFALRGGYPDPGLALDGPGDRAAWFEGYQRTFLERDLQRLATIDNLVGYQRLMRAAALRLGGLVNQADLARDVGLAPTTTQRYLHLLETLYQVVRVEAYAVNRTKRLVKSPKLHWSDTGLAMHLGALTEPTGAHLENLILGDLLTWRETRSHRPNILFWRTSKGAEVDLVVETPDRLLPIEVKSGPRVDTGDARHLHTFFDEYPERAPAGLLVHGGEETYWLTDRVLAAPWGSVVG